MSIKIRKEDALSYHEQGSPGKIEVNPTKVLSTQHDLALAYSPGVAEPCKEISNNPEDVYRYTSKGNLVGVISNGTAVLGLGDIGPEASKPVMEGKGVLFKKFAGIDVFDIEINEKDPGKFIQIVKSLEPTFGGINLEDIKAPESFIIEQTLRNEMNIPVMHDDQHGTAIISAAALLNALEVTGKKIEDIKIVINGAGAAAVACAHLYIQLGAKKEHMVMCDSKGVIRSNRTNLSPTKAQFATTMELENLEEAIIGSDMFLGLSKGNILKPEHIKSMNNNPIVFALANPDPEIDYELACSVRDDIIMATGRSDHPNQVNNVLGFPYIFRGALDVRATKINEEMKLAAVQALANLAKATVPDMVAKAYGETNIKFGRQYLIPKPLDPRLITAISPAVAKAAIDSGVAKAVIKDWNNYEIKLKERIGIDQKLISRIISRAQNDPKRLVLAEGDDIRTLKAAQNLVDEKIAIPILLGNKEKISQLITENDLDLMDCEIVDPYESLDLQESFARSLYQKRQRKGLTAYDARKLMKDRNYFGASMVEEGKADAMLTGLTKDYSTSLRPTLQVIGSRDGKKVAGMYIMNTKRGYFIFSDTTVNKNPSVEDMVDIIDKTTRAAHFFDIEPRVAVLSYSNFGSSEGEVPQKCKEVVRRAKIKYPELVIDGDIQANIAVNTELQQNSYPFSTLAGEGANVLIFPNLASGNIAYKLMMELGGAEALGPILLGMNKPVHILQMGSSIREIINMAAIAVVDAQFQVNR
jgi:malate dehydrogenase (oxaloacetate-decarboxylating)(NADP+)